MTDHNSGVVPTNSLSVINNNLVANAINPYDQPGYTRRTLLKASSRGPPAPYRLKLRTSHMHIAAFQDAILEFQAQADALHRVNVSVLDLWNGRHQLAIPPRVEGSH